ncbi:MAG: putative phosphothreonine lyase domain-containing protein [Crocinitomicaceae bacterium]
MAKRIKKRVDQPEDKLTDDRWWDSDFPSTISEDYWVYASVKNEQNHPRKFKNEKPGKWLVFTDISEIDTTWQTIKKATERGQLGLGSKAATAKDNPNATSASEKVICVYTYNWQDLNEINRVEKALRSIGIEQTLFYKTDSDTLQGKYKVSGSTGISKYISKGTRNYKKHEISSLPGIKEEKIEILKRIGINNFDDLLSFDTSKKLERVGISCEIITKLKLLALSQVEKKIFKLTPLQIPKENILHFDIETDLFTPESVRKIWSIAVHHKEIITHFYAESFKQTENIKRLPFIFKEK